MPATTKGGFRGRPANNLASFEALIESLDLEFNAISRALDLVDSNQTATALDLATDQLAITYGPSRNHFAPINKHYVLSQSHFMSADVCSTSHYCLTTTRRRSPSIGHARHASYASFLGKSKVGSAVQAGSEKSLDNARSTAPISSVSSDKNRTHFGRLPRLPNTFKTNLPQNRTGSRLIRTKHVFWVDRVWQLDIFLELLPSLIDHGRASMFCDQEGNQMDRNGTLSLLQITFATHEITFILDLTVLGKIIFERRSYRGQSLRQILEGPTIVKVYFDVRNASDAIYAHFGIHHRGVIDLQLIELVCRGIRCEPTDLQSLARCIELHLGPGLDTDEYLEWCQAKAAGRRYCEKHGWGGYDERPLPEVLVKYPAQDTIYMPHMYAIYLWKLQKCPRLMGLIIRASQKRADDSLLPEYHSGGYGKGLGPADFLVVDGDDDELSEQMEAAHLTSRDLMPPNQGW